MKVIFEFDTSEENFDLSELNRYYDVDKMAMCLEALREKVRSLIKWDERELIPKDEIEEKFFEIIEEEGISFERIGY